MNTSLNWIKAMVPGLECTDQEFRDAMTLQELRWSVSMHLTRTLIKS